MNDETPDGTDDSSMNNPHPDDTSATNPRIDPTLGTLRSRKGGFLRRNVRWVVPVGVLVGMILVAALVTSLWRTGDVAVRPGQVQSVFELTEIEGAEVYPPEGDISLLTARISSRLSVLERAFVSLESGVDIVPERVFTGGRPRSEQRSRNQQLMVSSQDLAALVALEYLGYTTRIADGLTVVEPMPGTPAAAVLQPGDVIVGADGVVVAELDDLRSVLAERRPGDEVRLELEGSDEPATVELIAAAEEPERALVGITLRPRLVFVELPVRISIDAGSTGGPSAGLALTLGIVDLLTPGELTGGLKVAVTGTIGLDGSVGPIGEVDQKTIAARRAEADLVLVPPANEAEALRHAGEGMEVVAVESLAEAVEVLKARGGELDLQPVQ